MDEPMSGPDEAVKKYWPTIRSDVETLSEEYEDEGWSVRQLHPGEITPMKGDAPAPALLDVLVPDDELDEIEQLAAEFGFDAFDVYRESAGGQVFLVVVLMSSDADTAVIYPAHYSVPEAQTFIEDVHDEGIVRTRLRNLADERAVTIEHDNPDPFLPE